MTLSAKIIVGIIALIFLYVIIDSFIWLNKPKKYKEYKGTNTEFKDRVNKLNKEILLNQRHKNRKIPYKEYLKTDHWQTIRKNALSRAGYKCQLCSNKNLRLNVHHNNYRNLWHETPQDLIVLCEKCHKKFHNKDY